MSLFTNKAPGIMRRLMRELGVTDLQAGGMLGNFGTETGGFSKLQEIKPVVTGSRGGYGWPQWTGKRRVQYEAWCRLMKLDPASDEANCGYVIVELKGAYAYVLTALKKTITLNDASDTFEKLYEGAGVPALQSRRNYAAQAMAAYQLEATARPGPAPIPAPPSKPVATPAPAPAPKPVPLPAPKPKAEKRGMIGATIFAALGAAAVQVGAHPYIVAGAAGGIVICLAIFVVLKTQKK